MGCTSSSASSSATTSEKDLADSENEMCACSHVPLFKNPIMESMMTGMVRRMVNNKVKIGDGKRDNTMEEAQAFEKKTWSAKSPEEYAAFKAARPYSVEGYQTQAPKVGDLAPDGPVLPFEAGGESTLLAELKKLAEAGCSKFCAISFDCVTCPVWRVFGGQDFHRAASELGVPVLHVYTREAHGSDDFDAPPNQKGPIALSQPVAMHKSEADRRNAAKGAHEIISKQVGGSVTMVLDSMSDALEKAYETRPFRMYIVEAASGKIAFAMGLTPFNMQAKTDAIKDSGLEAADPDCEMCDCTHMPLFKSPIMESMMTGMVRRMVNSKVKIGDGKRDNTMEEAQAFEKKTWSAKSPEEYAAFKAARPYSLEGYQTQAPQVGDNAPDGPVLPLGAGGASTLLVEVKKLAEAGLSKYCAISFDCVTCPVWRVFGGQDFHRAASELGVPVLHVYTREAHGSDDFDAPPNQKGPIALSQPIAMHKTEEDRRNAAKGAHEIISKQVGGSVAMVLDSMSDALEKAYETRPFRMYIVEAASGKIVFTMGLAPFNMQAKTDAIRGFMS